MHTFSLFTRLDGDDDADHDGSSCADAALSCAWLLRRGAHGPCAAHRLRRAFSHSRSPNLKLFVVRLHQFTCQLLDYKL